MTNEEAINTFKEWIERDKKMEYADRLENIEIYNIAIKALEQEPCEDCISRQAVDILVDELARAISDERCCISRGRSTATIMQDILDLPSVTPQLKTGRWIEDVDRWGDIVTTVNGYRCSECNAFNTHKDNYCPNCGARMESEER